MTHEVGAVTNLPRQLTRVFALSVTESWFTNTELLAHLHQ